MTKPTAFNATLALGLLYAGVAFAQASNETGVIPTPPPTASSPSDLQANTVEALLVTGRAAGPAWWSVTDDDTTVYVLGMPAFFPKGQRFETLRLRQRLDGANVLILGQAPHMKVGAFVRTVVGSKKKFRSAQSMREGLPPDLRMRLEARLTKDKAPLDAVDSDKPAFAGFRIAYDVNAEGAIDIGEPIGRIRNAAQSKELAKPPPIRKLSDFDLIAAAKALAAAPQPVQELCLDAGLRQAATGEDGIRATARRWAEGGAHDVLPVDESFGACLAAVPPITRDLIRGRDEASMAITEALNTPGKAVAVIELRSLLETNGVLDQLRAKGFTVVNPE